MAYPFTVSGMNWSQGESGAKAYPVAPGNTVPIFDSEEQVIYIKSVDVMGRPLPLKVLEYTERTNEPKEEKNYVEKTELEEAMTSLNEKLDNVLTLLSVKKEEKKEVKKDAK